MLLLDSNLQDEKRIRISNLLPTYLRHAAAG